MYQLFKRLIDLLLILLTLPIVFVLIVLFAVLIIVVDKFSPFFLQKRPGRNGRIFTCVKLRTLRAFNSQDKQNNKITNEKRVTTLGRFLRDHGIDELPQILNILLGEMSLIGPRPLASSNYLDMEELHPKRLPEIKSWKKFRQDVLPGLTGWYQVNSQSRGVIMYDSYYLKNRSLTMDLEIFIKSVFILILGKEIYFRKLLKRTEEPLLNVFDDPFNKF